MLIVGGVLESLRAAGAQLGWGFQLQSPAFVEFLSGLTGIDDLLADDTLEGAGLRRLCGLKILRESSRRYRGG